MTGQLHHIAASAAALVRRLSQPGRRSLLCLVIAAAPQPPARGAGFLAFPDTIDGYPTNVGLLILGHSTSAQGQYPAKLVAALNDPAHTLDGRHYLAFTAITPSDGGLLWSLLQVPPTDSRFDRVTASPGVGESSPPQWCEAGDGTRWSCRRAKLDHLLTGTWPIPASGTCADPAVSNACRAAAAMPCTWYDRGLPLAANPVTQSLAPAACWAKMDVRLALVQDTTNRSWPLDDFDGSGVVDDLDPWPADRIARSRALPCGGTTGVIGGAVDWTCDGTIDAADAAHRVYASWLGALATDLRDPLIYGAAALDAVFIGHKPVELGQCSLWPTSEQTACATAPHAQRSPAQVATTPDRPYDRYYLPSVYWELAALEQLFAEPGLDPKIRPASRDDLMAMWRQSAACYSAGLSVDDWRIPAAVAGRPSAIAADVSEIDSGSNADADTVGCMVDDHIHHNASGGWLMADVWYARLAADLWIGLSADSFESGDSSGWSVTFP